MTEKVYVYSTLVADQAYGVKGSPETILIKGGSHITRKDLVTPYGIMTTITPEQLLALQENHVFNLHSENGFITVDDKPRAVEDVVATMNSEDSSKPDTKESLEAAVEEAAVAAGSDAPAVKSNAKPKGK